MKDSGCVAFNNKPLADFDAQEINFSKLSNNVYSEACKHLLPKSLFSDSDNFSSFGHKAAPTKLDDTDSKSNIKLAATCQRLSSCST